MKAASGNVRTEMFQKATSEAPRETRKPLNCSGPDSASPINVNKHFGSHLRGKTTRQTESSRGQNYREAGGSGESGSSNDFKEGEIFGKIMPWFYSVCVMRECV